MKHVKLITAAVLISFFAAAPALAGTNANIAVDAAVPVTTLPTVVVTPSKAQMAELAAEERMNDHRARTTSRVAQNARESNACRSGVDTNTTADERCPL